MVSKAINLAMRGLEFLWALLVMALVGNMIAESYAGDPSIVNYSMFLAVFAMLSLFYLIPATVKEELAFHPLLMVALDAINTLLWLCGAIALASYLGAHSCSNAGYVLSNGVTNGSHNPSKRCREAQAVCAFLWFGFAAFLVSTILSALQNRGSANMRGSGGIRRGPPAMSQV